jgi:hypothetical protein
MTPGPSEGIVVVDPKAPPRYEKVCIPVIGGVPSDSASMPTVTVDAVSPADKFFILNVLELLVLLAMSPQSMYAGVTLSD